MLKKLLPFIAVSLLLGGVYTAQAATLGVVVSDPIPDIGQSFRVDVPLDMQGADANAVQAQIVFPADQFILQSVDDGNSPISFWIESPEEIASGVVAFSGIMPGGLQGMASSVVSLWLKPARSGPAVISLGDVELLSNDGQATPIATATGTAMITVSTIVSSSTASHPISFITPETFTPVVSHDPNLFGGKYFLAFSTTDKGSGIDRYEVLEAPAAGSWQPATSPYLLQDQSLESTIYVRAVDHAGNFIVVEVPPAHPAGEQARHVQDDWLFIVLSLLLIMIILLARGLLKRK